MDNLDAMIIRDLAYNPTDPLHAARGRLNPWDTARSMGVHGTTVKRRLAELRAEGTLQGVHLVPAGAILGRRTTYHSVVWPNVSAKQAGVKRLLEEPETWAVHTFLGEEAILGVSTPLDVDADAVVAEMARDTGAVSTRFLCDDDWNVDVPRVTALDLRILASLAEDAQRSPGDIAAEVGVTRKTVTRRLTALSKLQAFSIHPHVAGGGDGLLCFLELNIDPEQAAAARLKLLHEFRHAVCRSIHADGKGFVVVGAESAAALEADLVRAQSVPGVRSVRVLVCSDSYAAPGRVRDALMARSYALLAERRSPSYAPRVAHA